MALISASIALHAAEIVLNSPTQPQNTCISRCRGALRELYPANLATRIRDAAPMITGTTTHSPDHAAVVAISTN